MFILVMFKWRGKKSGEESYVYPPLPLPKNKVERKNTNGCLSVGTLWKRCEA